MSNFKTRITVLLACLGAQAMVQVVHADTFHTVDVLGVYSDHVAQRVSDPRALFASHIEYANKALQNSGANYRYNLVHVEQRNWPKDDSLGGTQLTNLAQDAPIKLLRDEHGADLVAGMVPSSGGLCGIGYVPSANRSNQTLYSWTSKYGYSLSGHNCGGRTMAHEIGHNMGLAHSPEQRGEGSLAKWGRGWGVNGSFVTIMAYNGVYGVYSSAGRLQIHSNPALSVCRGQACGKAITAQDGADATRALNLAAPQIADWRDSVVVVSENKPPVANHDSVSMDADTDTPVKINVLANDHDPDDEPIRVSSVTAPAYGQAAISADHTKVAYTLTDDTFVGQDTFEYTIVDARGATASASISVQVKAVVTPPGGDGSEDANLVVNPGAESELNGWTGVWRTRLALGNDAHSGERSVRASGGMGVFTEIRTPIRSNRNLEASGWLKATVSNRMYVYLRVRQNGRWSYQYMTTVSLIPGQWQRFKANRLISGAEIEQGYVTLYFPGGIRGELLIDDLGLKMQ